jgi:hypothetical protein
MDGYRAAVPAPCRGCQPAAPLCQKRPPAAVRRWNLLANSPIPTDPHRIRAIAHFPPGGFIFSRWRDEGRIGPSIAASGRFLAPDSRRITMRSTSLTSDL